MSIKEKNFLRYKKFVGVKQRVFLFFNKPLVNQTFQLMSVLNIENI